MSEQPVIPEQPEEDAPKEDNLPKEVEKLIKDLPEVQQKAVEALIIALSLKFEKTSWRGPLPPPEILRGYNEAVPDGAERILKMAETQSKHRMEMEKTVIPEEQSQSRLGQNYALIIALAFLVVSGVLIWYDHDVAGTVMGSIDLVALVTAFIWGKSTQKRNTPIISEEDD